jgi:hypothetical protein
LIQDRVSLNLAYFHITEFNVALEQANGFIFQGNRFYVRSRGGTSGADHSEIEPVRELRVHRRVPRQFRGAELFQRV